MKGWNPAAPPCSRILSLFPHSLTLFGSGPTKELAQIGEAATYPKIKEPKFPYLENAPGILPPDFFPCIFILLFLKNLRVVSIVPPLRSFIYSVWNAQMSVPSRRVFMLHSRILWGWQLIRIAQWEEVTSYLKDNLLLVIFSCDSILIVVLGAF